MPSSIIGNVAELSDVYSEVKEHYLMAEGGPILLKENDVQLPASPTQKSKLKTSEEKAIEAIKHTAKYVKLNIGGFLYYTTLDTLTKEDNMLRAMFSGRLDVKTDGDGT